MSEMAVVTARKSRLQDWAVKGNAKAKVALELANNPNRFLSAVQIGITLVGILAGAYGGRTIADRLATSTTKTAAMWQPVLTLDYIATARRVADRRMLLAGYCLANVLTQVVSN
jgi:CBS domain containing-hemolysin-like protein